ncbi:MAG TPA: ABC transporter permease [Trueperaceae bacterium]|nr:ABC transporter permease [Trueperaceae bacterium]
MRPPALEVRAIPNRIAMLGSAVAALGFFFLPVVTLKPNRISAGVPFNLLQFQGDYRYIVLFALALVPFMIAFRKDVGVRGWLLVIVGNLLMLLTLVLPAIAGQHLLANAKQYLGPNAFIQNPRLLPTGGLALGLVGGYVTLFAGLRDLERSGVQGWVRSLAAWLGVAFIFVLLVAGAFNIYSIMVEFHTNGALLQQKFVEHLMFVAVSLVVGFVVGVGLGLWASRDERMAPMILYAVGIIQTIPSLALFGVLLVPLARLGDMHFLPSLEVFAGTVVVAVAVGLAYRLVAGRLPSRVQTAALILVALIVAVPLVLFTGVFVSFVYRAARIGFGGGGGFGGIDNAILALVVVGLALWAGRRWLFKREGAFRLVLRIGYLLAYSGALVVLMVMMVRAAATDQFLGSVTSVQALTIRNLGVSGIGVAPALVALTLYSLLPLVRNTYAGLENVDNAIIDSGRGMGMTPAQIFFQIELPLAFPVIMAGVRNAGVALVGIGTVATVIGAGGLGDFVIQGIVNTSVDQILLGAIPAIALAMVLDAVLRFVEGLLTSPGIRHVQNT